MGRPGEGLAINKGEINKFLAGSNRREFRFRLLIATTDKIGRNARNTLNGQEKPVGELLRGGLLTEEIKWPTKIGG